jgi:hypothetical protein
MMAEFNITLDDGRKLKITGDSEAAAANAAQQWAKDNPNIGVAEDVAKSAGTGLLKAFTSNLAGLPGDVQRLVEAGSERLLGPDTRTPEQRAATHIARLPTSETIQKKMEDVGVPFHQPESMPGRFAQSVAEMGGPLGWLGRGTRTAKVLTNVGAGVGAQAGEELTGSPYGRLAGGIAGSLSPATAVRTASPIAAATPELTAAANRLIARGILPTAGQATGSNNLQMAEGLLGNVPGAGAAAKRFEDTAQRAFNRNLFQSAGYDADRATQQNINGMFRNLDREFNDIKARNALPLTPQVVDEIRNAVSDYHAVTPVANQVRRPQDILDEINQRAGGLMSGEAYQSWRSQLSDMARDAVQSTRNVSAGNALRRIVNALDDGMERALRAANSPDLGRFRELRRRWGNAATITDALGSGDRANDFTPRGLVHALESRDPRGYARGQGDLAQIARDADLLLQALPEHKRNWWYLMHLVGAPVAAFFAGLPISASVIAAEPILGRTIMSDPMQAYLRNQAAVPLRTQVPGVGSAVLRGGISGLEPTSSDDALR